MNLTFKRKYFFLAGLIFIVEVLIACYALDKMIRPYVGDMLVVILLYCFVRTFIKGPVITIALCVLAFSYLVETMQYFKLVNLLGLQNSKLANILIGNSFGWMDILAYSVGIAIIILAERFRKP